ncbi:biotin transport system substrate-specific component [Thalassovita litoralis]|jgi:biotin transport system substrate-specific component|uniref:Biotin transporter n=1 Tax=Thalassovita litoralis TaxID=1010611 RepID=A0A521FPA5_9RHOB|nr:biotin transporter BioY [Thalassovita litoralis]SMO97979.1 biotin transport system substrate-specific component [Thalassovita litoralis]
MERNLTLIALFAALIAALGLVPKFTLMSGVPISAQSLGIMLCGTVLGAKRGGLAVLLFLGLVALGLPLLAGGRGGIGVFSGVTMGYLIGFPVAAFVTGALAQMWRDRGGFVFPAVAALIGGVVVLNVLGIVGMAIKLDKTLAEAALLATPFIPGDILKCVLAGLITQGLLKARPGLAQA